MAELVKQFASGIYNLILGLFTTTKHLGRHAITIQYPKERWEIPERSRGMVVLLTDHETGKLNCTACMLCMKACPTAAIDIGVYKDEKKKRHLESFTVDYNICCFCGLCEESCNFAAIKMATKFEFPAFDKKDLFWDMDKLAKMGLDVPYEKPVRKKPAAKKPVAKKPAEPKAETPAETKPAEAKTETPTEANPAEPKAETLAETKPAEAKTEPPAESEKAAPEGDKPDKDDSGPQKDEGQ
ncbi:MAG: 4Fe-4S dicluster domain-containing protein [FCB group bacterium]|nr:4Fe-4S dicluster domain-containing protein [FCB group bacterium]